MSQQSNCAIAVVGIDIGKKIGTGDAFCKGRDFGAWLGLVARFNHFERIW